MAKPKRKDVLPTFLWVGGLLVVGSLGVYAALTKDASLLEKQRAVAQARQEQGVKVVQIPHSTIQNNEPAISTEPKEVPPGADPKLVAVNEFIKVTPAIPREARAKSVKVVNGVATIDFTKEFQHGYGTDDESTIVNGLLTALGQFKDVEKVTFTVESQPLDTLGSSDLSAPVPVRRIAATTSLPPN